MPASPFAFSVVPPPATADESGGSDSIARNTNIYVSPQLKDLLSVLFSSFSTIGLTTVKQLP